MFAQGFLHHETRTDRVDTQIPSYCIRIDKRDSARWYAIFEYGRKNLAGKRYRWLCRLTSYCRVLLKNVISAQREERWNEWKNKSCPELKRPNPVQVDFKERAKKEKFLGDTLKEFSNRKKYFMGR